RVVLRMAVCFAGVGVFFVSHSILFLFVLRPPPRPTLFPYTTLFRSQHAPGHARGEMFVGWQQGQISVCYRVQRHFRQHADAKARSEEHTSELQSRENLVCRLLLEKKNLRTMAVHL